MIGYLEGVILCRDVSGFIVNVNGVGYKIIEASKSCAQLKPGDNARLYTYLNVKEDALQLFGFVSQDEKYLFEKLISVSKVGPKIAAAILMSFTAEQVISYISSKNIALLSSVPGLGKKTAERIVLDLKDKIGISVGDIESNEDSAYNEAKEALMSLGYTQNEAISALKELQSVKTVEEMIKAALARITK